LNVGTLRQKSIITTTTNFSRSQAVQAWDFYLGSYTNGLTILINPKSEMTVLIAKIWQGMLSNIRWLSWNLFLAFVPLALSFWLFRQKKARSVLWWLGLLVFLAFLPNAPYVLTDVIHLIEASRRINSVWVITIVLIPTYVVYALAGFEAYVLSLINVGYYLNRLGLGRWVLRVELLIHFLSAIGIYLGRFLRFNSWDLIAKPDTLATGAIENLAGKRPLAIVFTTYVVVAGFYWVMKKVSLAILLNRHKAITSRQPSKDIASR